MEFISFITVDVSNSYWNVIVNPADMKKASSYSIKNRLMSHFWSMMLNGGNPAFTKLSVKKTSQSINLIGSSLRRIDQGKLMICIDFSAADQGRNFILQSVKLIVRIITLIIFSTQTECCIAAPI